MAIIQWNEKNTQLRKYDLDSKMVEAVQRLLNFYGPVQSTPQPNFPKAAPPEFGKHFRKIRNRTAHADYRRMAPNLGSEDISLAEFFARYHFYYKLLVSGQAQLFRRRVSTPLNPQLLTCQAILLVERSRNQPPDYRLNRPNYLEHPQLVWGGTNFGKYTWAPVKEFMQVVRKSDL